MRLPFGLCFFSQLPGCRSIVYGSSSFLSCGDELRQDNQRAPATRQFQVMTTSILPALDLATVRKGQSVQDAIDRTVEAAQYIEDLGYERIWLAEHHNMEHIASSATAVLIGHVAGKTTRIRVGSGGVML